VGLILADGEKWAALLARVSLLYTKATDIIHTIRDTLLEE